MVRLALLLLLLACPAVAQDGDPMRLELVLDDRSEAPFVGEMILATIRGTYRARITREELKLRPMTDFDWLRLGQDVWTDARIDGRAARVMERRVALYPRRAGTLEILPVAQNLEVLGPDNARETRIVRSDPVTVEVRAAPAGASDDWLPVRALELSDGWSAEAGRLADGQSVERRVVLRALGATPEMLPEQPALREPWLITFTPPEQRDLQVTPQGPVTTIVWTWTLRPVTGEPGVLPEVAIPWFDTAARAARNATIPAAPIGYASFADNAGTGWRAGPGVGVPHLTVLAAALLAGLAFILGRERTFALDCGRLRRWMRTRMDLLRLRHHARTGASAPFRSLATRLLAEQASASRHRDHPILRPVDTFLFGPGSSRAPDLGPIFRKVKRELRRRRSVPRDRDE